MLPLNQYQLILFDMDGTLYFQRPLQIHMALKMLIATLKPGGLRELQIVLRFRKLREHWQSTPDNGGQITGSDENLDRVQYDTLALQTGLSAYDIETIIQKWIYRKPLEIIHRYCDNTLTEIIKKYHLQNKQVAIYSDYPAVGKRDALGLPPVPCFYGGQKEISCMKPNPKGIQFIMEHYNIDAASKVLIIGDRLSKDGQAAAAAGADYIILKKHKFQRIKQYNALLSE